MTSCYFRNEVTWPYTKIEALFSFFTGSVAENMKLLMHQKLDIMIF